ncbi:hypothetical protein JM946_05510 [Steroidobacter sp. S1-65]|uniref:Uncharacterized protein n=1 Tax=Steroidobacter gossypii TaxID=2805490 RepID=A0ABS1WT96_9GAMM|nr:hypothetical protein [Steroidobacter gossypii]MBM0104190.1 hypothetical protein [Steroidobacter gossypii]
MSAPKLPCEHCRALVPRFVVSDEQFQAIIKALSDGSTTLATAELKHFVHCKDEEAQAWMEHLLSCASSWPLAEADQQVLHQIDQVFGEVPKPDHFTNHTHCSECEEHDSTLRMRTRETLRREDLGSSGWDPLNFSSAAGIGYLFPALARFALLPDACSRRHDWYGSQLLFHLSFEAGSNRFLAWCSPRQANAVYDLLCHLAATRLHNIEDYGQEALLRTALDAWRRPDLPKPGPLTSPLII